MTNFLKGNTWSTVYKKVLCVGGDSSDHAGLTASEKNVWTDDGADGKTAACFQLSTDTLLITGTNQLQFNDSGTYMYSNANGDLDIISDGSADDAINLESTGGITLDAGGASNGIVYEDDATQMLRIFNASSDVILKPLVTDKDIIFQEDGGTEIARLDSSAESLLMATSKKIMLGAAEEYVYGDGTDIHFGVGANGDINIPANIGLTFGHATGDKIEGTGSVMTITAQSLNIDCAGSILIDADSGVWLFNDNGTEILKMENSSGDIIFKPRVDAKDIIFQQYDGTEVARIEDGVQFNVSATTASTSATTGALITGGGLGVANDAYFAEDIVMIADSKIIKFGADSEILLTHLPDSGLQLYGTHANGTNLILDNGATDGDPRIQFALSGTTTWSIGCDDGGSDSLVIERGAGALGAQPALTFDSSGNATFAGTVAYSSLSVSQSAAAATATVFTLDQASHSDTDGHRQSQIVFTGEKSGGEEVTMAKIIGAHDGGSDDQKGYLEFTTNTSGDDATPTTALKLSADKTATFAGDLSIPAAKKLYLDAGNNTYIHESSGDTVKFYIGGADRLVLDTASFMSMSNNDSGTSNTLFGKNAGASLDAGSNYNVFIGENVSDATMDDATYNVGIGYQALSALTQGDDNVCIGANAGLAGTSTFNDNIVIGKNALTAGATTVTNNIAIGTGALSVTVASNNNNIAIGYEALKGTSTAANNTNVAVGSQSLYSANTASYSTCVGYQSGYSATTGVGNVAIGYAALKDNQTTHYSVAVGMQALENTTAVGNIGIGYKAGELITTGTNNIIMGYDSDVDTNSRVGCVVIGYNLSLNTASDNVVEIGNNTNSMTYDLDGGDITVTSDSRIKMNVKDTKLGLDFINKLRPITYETKPSSQYPKIFGIPKESQTTKKSGKVWDGLIAQEVKAAMDDLDVGFSGWSEGINTKQTLAYGKLIMPLIKAVQELSAKVEALENK